jgi:CheY-like chemotaxis protein
VIRSWEKDPSANREAASRTPIVAVTASTTGDVRSKCLASGMDDVITKPLDAALLREVLERWLRKGT